MRDIRRVTRKQYSAEEKIRIVLDGLREQNVQIAITPPQDLAEDRADSRRDLQQHEPKSGRSRSAMARTLRGERASVHVELVAVENNHF